MRILVAYDSMFGNTHQVAEAIAKGLEVVGNVEVESCGLLVVGSPTHVHRMPSDRSREAAS